MIRQRRRALVVLLLAVGASCDKPAPEASNDTVVVQPPPPGASDSVESTLKSTWDSGAGPVFLSIGPNASTASVVFPHLAPDAEVSATALDAQSLRGRTFDLLGSGQIFGQGTIAGVVALDAPEDCSGWPLVQLSGLSGDTTARSWAVGFEKGRAVPIPYDSISFLTSTDSSRLAIEVARLASALPGDTVSALRGLPYQVRRAYRFTLAPGREVLLTEVLRSLNQEATPIQEHILIIAERDSTSLGKLEVAYSERAAGGEETLESSELLTVLRLAPAGDAVLVLARYVGDGVVYAWIERTGARQWRLRWSSPYVGC